MRRDHTTVPHVFQPCSSSERRPHETKPWFYNALRRMARHSKRNPCVSIQNAANHSQVTGHQTAKCRNNIAQVWQHGIGLGKACIATAQPEPPAVSSTTRHEKRSSIKHYPTATSRLPHEKAVFSKVFATEGHKVLSSDDIISVILLPFRVECSIVNENEQPKAPTTLGCERVSQCVCSVRRTLVRDVEKNYVFFDRNSIILFQSAVRNHAIGT